jgi:hypothetical protein
MRGASFQFNATRAATSSPGIGRAPREKDHTGAAGRRILMIDETSNRF